MCRPLVEISRGRENNKSAKEETVHLLLWNHSLGDTLIQDIVSRLLVLVTVNSCKSHEGSRYHHKDPRYDQRRSPSSKGPRRKSRHWSRTVAHRSPKGRSILWNSSKSVCPLELKQECLSSGTQTRVEEYKIHIQSRGDRFVLPDCGL